MANANNGVSIQAEVVANLERATTQINQVNEVVNQIALSSNEQLQNVGQITKAIEQINTVTQQVAANAEESAASSAELASQSTSMGEMVAEFELGDSSHESRLAA